MPPSARMRTPWFCLKVGQCWNRRPRGKLLNWAGRGVVSSLSSVWRRDFQELPALTHAPLPPSPGDEVYSTIRKQEYNGKIPRFRRIRGESELYTSDTVMQSESGSDWAEGGPGGVST